VSYAVLRPAILFGGDGVLLNNIAWLLRRLPVFAIGGVATIAFEESMSMTSPNSASKGVPSDTTALSMPWDRNVLHSSNWSTRLRTRSKVAP